MFFFRRTAQREDLEVVKYLVKIGANLEARDSSKRTPLMWVFQWGCLDVVKYLVEAGANIEARAINGSRHTPLLAATSFGLLEVVKYLVEAGGDGSLDTGSSLTAE